MLRRDLADRRAAVRRARLPHVRRRLRVEGRRQPRCAPHRRGERRARRRPRAARRRPIARTREGHPARRCLRPATQSWADARSCPSRAAARRPSPCAMAVSSSSAAWMTPINTGPSSSTRARAPGRRRQTRSRRTSPRRGCARRRRVFSAATTTGAPGHAARSTTRDRSVDPDGRAARTGQRRADGGPAAGRSLSRRRPHERLVRFGAFYDKPVAEIYDATRDAWSTVTPPQSSRQSAGGALLADGRVLIAGGHPGSTAERLFDATAHGNSEIFDPATGTWSPTGELQRPRGSGSTVITLADGRRRRPRGFVGDDHDQSRHRPEAVRPTSTTKPRPRSTTSRPARGGRSRRPPPPASATSRSRSRTARCSSWAAGATPTAPPRQRPTASSRCRRRHPGRRRRSCSHPRPSP